MMRHWLSQHNDGCRPAHRAAGFTIVELLTAVAIVIVIVSIVIVAINSAVRSAQRTNTQSLLTAISQGLTQFKEETGYHPPVLDPERNLRFQFSGGAESMSGPDPGQLDFNIYRDQVQEWFSFTSLADYLLGHGPVQQASNGEFWSPDGYAGAGITNPGDDGYWGASVERPGLADPGTYQARLDFLDPEGAFATQSRRFREGPVLGPYLQLTDERLLGAIDPDNLWLDEEQGQMRVYFAGEALPPGLNWEEMPKVIVDYWGQPIRYFRKPYPQGLPGSAYRRVQGHETFGDPAWSPPSLAHVIALRPFSITPGQEADAPPMGRTGGTIVRFGDEVPPDAPGGTLPDTTATHSLLSGDFGLLSAGPNRSMNIRTRADELNRGNLVEVGP
jgi:type II secretory pathway pseudopilin PulG